MPVPTSLLAELAAAWAGNPPEIPESLKTDMEFGRYYKYIAGRKWDEIDLEHPKFDSEWGYWLPAEAEGYYLATYLNYLLQLLSANRIDVPFFNACALLCRCDVSDPPLPPARARVARLTIDHLLNALPQLGFAEPDETLRNLEFAQSRWAELEDAAKI